MTLASKEGYLAKGDTVSPTEGPIEDVVGNTQTMNAARFEQIQATNAALRRFASTAWSAGGVNVDDREGRLHTGVQVAAGAGSTFTYTRAADGTEYDASAGYIAGHCPPRPANGNVAAATASDFLIDLASADNVDVAFEDDGASEYNVGIACSVIPVRAEANPRTGLYEFTEESSVIGVKATPSAVSYDSGLDETTLTLSNETLLGNNSSLAGRTAVVWYVDSTTGGPLGDTSTAIFVGTVTNTGSNEIVVSGAFGQDSGAVSTTAGDYRFCILGPAVWVSGAAETSEAGVAHLAYGRSTGGGSWDMDGQTLFPSMHQLLSKLISMSAPSLSDPDFVSSPKLEITPNDNEADATPQITVWGDAAATDLVFEVRKDGEVVGSVIPSYENALEDLANNLDEGDVGRLRRGRDKWAGSVSRLGSTVTSPEDVCCTSTHYILAGQNGLERCNRVTSGDVDVTYTITNTYDTIVRVVCSAFHVAFVHHDSGGGNYYVEVWPIGSASSSWVYTTTTEIKDIAINSLWLSSDSEIVIAEGDTLQQFTVSGGNTPTQILNHDATINGVVCTGYSEFVCYGADSGGTGDTTSGNAIVKVAPDPVVHGVIWERDWPTINQSPANDGQIVYDGTHVFIMVTDTIFGDSGLLRFAEESGRAMLQGSLDVEDSGGGFGSTQGRSFPLPGAVDQQGEPHCLEVDDQWLYLVKDSKLAIIDKDTMTEVSLPTTSVTSAAGLAVDFEVVYYVGDHGGNSVAYRSPHRGLLMTKPNVSTDNGSRRARGNLTIFPISRRSL